jgi:hypothetical protein
MINNTLCHRYINYINTTNNLCLYKFCNSIPSGLFFPKTTTLTLINCSKNGVSNILNPKIVPNLKNINYISSDPSNNIYDRFSDSIEWVFPNKNLDFYNNMVSTGRGKKCNNLINEYVASKRIIDGSGKFDIAFEFDLKIPEYGIVNGNWWSSQFNNYLVQHSYNLKTQISDAEELHLVYAAEEMELEKERVAAETEFYTADELLFK